MVLTYFLQSIPIFTTTTKMPIESNTIPETCWAYILFSIEILQSKQNIKPVSPKSINRVYITKREYSLNTSW